MKVPDIPLVYILWVLSVIALAAGARFRLAALLAAGAAPPGSQRAVKALKVFALDTAAFLATCYVFRLSPFPILMSGILLFAATAALLWAQWTFRKAPGTAAAPPPAAAPPATPPAARPEPSRSAAASAAASARNAAAAGGAAAARSLRGGVQGIQDAALSAGYGRLESMVMGKIEANRWVAGVVYQAAMVVVCLGLRVLDMLQGPWLYVLFSLMWQSGVTGALYWQFDRRKQTGSAAAAGAGPEVSASGRAPNGSAAASSGAAAGPAGVPGSVRAAPAAGGSLFSRLPYVAPGISAGPARLSNPAARSSAASSADAHSAPRPRKRKFALRSDVQAVVALTAGIWCGIFSRLFGWAYGFGSVALFRTILSFGSPVATALLGKYVPAALQPYLKVQPKTPMLSLRYLKSREFWYGPGMGMVGGAAGAVLRHIVLGR